jgi:hypothetical protein
LYLIL